MTCMRDFWTLSRRRCACAATACHCHTAAHFGVLVCSLLAALPECFTNKHTQIGRRSERIDAVALQAALLEQRGQLIANEVFAPAPEHSRITIAANSHTGQFFFRSNRFGGDAEVVRTFGDDRLHLL